MVFWRSAIHAGLLTLWALAASTVRAETPAADDVEHFELHVRPVLAGTCATCHGSQQASGGLRVDSREALLVGGEHGPALVPGDAEQSLLMQAVRRTHDEVVMPPDEELATSVIDALARWIERGAAWPAPREGQGDPFATATHWAFQPLAPVEPPPGDDDLSPIDRFVDARLREEGLTPTVRAEPIVLLRRAYFDLLGLPPTPAEVDDFLADRSPEAWPRLIERLLASPHYGERWGRHWLDVVRYADTAGDNADYPVPEARLYRDYVIDSWQQDKPYDQFLREQLAGDLLAAEAEPYGPQWREQIIATGYLALARRYATAPYELWHLTLEDVIDTTGRAMLGLSLRCARCHDHKYDPVTQADYYALYGIFGSTQFAWAGGEEYHSKQAPREHFVPLVAQAEIDARAAELQEQIATCEAKLATAKESDDKQLAKRLQRELDGLRRTAQYGLPPEVPCAYAVREGTASDACIHLRGEPDDPGPVVPRGVPAFLAGDSPPIIDESSSGRLELAEWLTRPEHPLTARVMANRIWQWHFGRGLVATSSDFGLRGSPPTNGPLLDWLAGRFVQNGWSIKSLHREIMLSEAYQRSSRPRPELAASNGGIDPDNLYHWRFDRRRLDAESLRDALLLASGRLDLSRPGAHPFPPLPEWRWTQHAPFKAVYESSHRSVYLMTQRFARHPYLALFDGPDPNTSTGTRTSAIVPSQALYLRNNPFVTEQAHGLTERLIQSAPDATARVELACQICWGRRPGEEEKQQALEYIASVSTALAQDDLPPQRVEMESWTSYARVLFASHEFNYID